MNVSLNVSQKEFPQRVQHNVCNGWHKSQREDRFWRVSSKFWNTILEICFRFVEMMLPPNANPMDAPTWFSRFSHFWHKRENCQLGSLEDVLSVQPTADPLSKPTDGPICSNWNCIFSRWQKPLSNSQIFSQPSISVPPPTTPHPPFLSHWMPIKTSTNKDHPQRSTRTPDGMLILYGGGSHV